MTKPPLPQPQLDRLVRGIAELNRSGRVFRVVPIKHPNSFYPPPSAGIASLSY